MGRTCRLHHPRLHRARPLDDRLSGRSRAQYHYVVLGGLEHDSAPTQAQLATSVRRDKTRLIAILDRLEDRGLLHRTPDPDDRRNRIVALTDAGRTLLADCRRDVRAMEADLLSTLSAADRTAFVRALSTLAEPTPEDTGVRQ